MNLHYEETITSQLKEFIDVLEKNAEEMGLRIKREETWINTNMFSYDKELLVQGVFLTATLKSMSRVYFEINEIFPSCESKLTTIQTSGQAVAKNG